jgi:hypothetical protein
MFCIRKDNKYLSKSGEWVPLIQVNEIHFFEHWIHVAQKNRDGEIVKTIGVLKEVIHGNPDTYHHLKVLEEQQKLIKELNDRLIDAQNSERESEAKLLELRTANIELQTLLNETKSQHDSGWLQSIGRLPDTSNNFRE